MNEEILKILACPACAERPPLNLKQEISMLVCAQCSRQYPILDGIPNLLVESVDIMKTA
ncbi:MAG: Trm112 family protein [Elusimicrobia bacterium]|nr:Trm112 family protein [Elusimicrobiota bacterium]